MNKLVRNSKLFLRKNSSTILTCVGAAGVVATAVLSAKATPKALDLLEEARDEKGEDLTAVEVVRIAGPPYIPAILMGASTIACIFGANTINKHHQAALMSAYALVDTSYKEYKAKVKELYGEEADAEVKTKIAQDKYEAMAMNASPSEEDKELFYDFYSGRYFESTMADVKEAEYRLNRKLSMEDYAYLNDFYEFLGIDTIDPGYKLGWSSGSNFELYWQCWIDFHHEKTTMDDGLECIIISIMHDPIIDFEDY